MADHDLTVADRVLTTADHDLTAADHDLIGTFTRSIAVVPFDEAAAVELGHRADILRRRGTPIGVLDTMIAAHALSLDLMLVTNNTQHFSRVPKLRIENWF